MRVKRLIACIAMTLSLGGCGLLVARYVDVSEEEGIRELVSTRHATGTDLLLLGVDAYPSEKRVVFYELVPYPGFDGPEVLSRSVLPKGTRLEITGAQRCMNCYPRSIRMRVRVDGFAEDAPVYISKEWMRLLD